MKKAMKRPMNKEIPSRLLPLLVATGLLNACASPERVFDVEAARIANGEAYKSTVSDDVDPQRTSDRAKGFQSLTPLSSGTAARLPADSAAAALSQSDALNFAADNMPLPEFIHSVFGELLKLNYVMAEEISTSELPVTLNLQRSVSSRELYQLSAQILDSKEMSITTQDGIYFIGPKKVEGKGGQTIGIGRRPADVPQVVGPVMQIVPIKYGINISLERTLNDLINARVVPDFEKNVLFITGERSEILRALDLISLLDLPPSRSQHVGILRLTYTNPEQFIGKISKLLKAEGIPVDAGDNGKTNLVLVPLEQIGAVAVFGSDQLYLDRVNYWASQLDQPSEGAEKRYYVFHPRFARAADLGTSISALIGGSSAPAANRQGNQNRDTASAFGNNQQRQQQSSQPQQQNQNNATSGSAVSVRTDAMTMTVDDRSNTIIFYTSGIQYQTLLPMIRRLDVMPKQILLEATIAEVTLTDDLAMGVEFAIKNGKFSTGTKDAFGVSKFGGLGLSYIDGAESLLVQLKQSNSNVNVLSSPSIVVRDGVTATMSVGTDVPVVSATTINPGTETESQSVEYRRTGVELAVTPTINAQGLVVLQINQSISNTEEGSTLAGSPIISARAVTTEVLAQSGQTVMLAGMMSESKNRVNTKVPLLGDLPLLGNLFQGEKDSTRKTELILLITPKVIDQPEQWQQIRLKLDNGLKYLKLHD
jgi:general secretion pathway protein D